MSQSMGSAFKFCFCHLTSGYGIALQRFSFPRAYFQWPRAGQHGLSEKHLQAVHIKSLLNVGIYYWWIHNIWNMKKKVGRSSFQFSSVAQSCPTLCDPMNCSTPGHPVHHQLLEFTQAHVHWVGDAIQPSHPLSSPSLPAPNPSQHQGLFQWVNSSHEVAKVLEFQLQHQSFQWIPRTDLL